jgi:hypothetical protein
VEIALGLIILALYGWYMYKQGRTRGFLTGTLSGGITVAATLVHYKKLTRKEAFEIMPFIQEESFDEIMELVKNATVQSKKHTD